MTNEQLVSRIKSGEDIADNMLILWDQNKRLIYKIAKKYAAFAEMDDLLQEGYIGLCNATYDYDLEEGPFLNYAALWIRQAMLRYVENNGSCIRIPSHAQQKMRAYHKAQDEFMRHYGRKAEDEEMRRYLGMSRKEYETVRQGLAMKESLSLDKEHNEGSSEDSFSLLDVTPNGDNIERDVLDRMEQEELREKLWSLVDSLPEDQTELLKMRYLENMSLKQTAANKGLEYNKARSVIEKGLRTLRHPKYLKQLRPYLPDHLIPMAYYGSAQSFRNTWTSSTERTAIKLVGE